jgi:hypothetical protein
VDREAFSSDNTFFVAASCAVKVQVQKIMKLVKKIIGLKQRRKNGYLLDELPHPSSSPDTEELVGWNAWP